MSTLVSEGETGGDVQGSSRRETCRSDIRVAWSDNSMMPVGSSASVRSAWYFAVLWNHKRFRLNLLYDRRGMHLLQSHSCKALVGVHDHDNPDFISCHRHVRWLGGLEAKEEVVHDALPDSHIWLVYQISLYHK